MWHYLNRTIVATLVTIMILSACGRVGDNEILESACEGSYKGLEFFEPENRELLKEIIEDHRQWFVRVFSENENLDTAMRDPLRANLCSANLWTARLTGVNLAFADLRDAQLGFAQLDGARLTGANLSGAKLGHTVLSEANLVSADLTGAVLIDTDLSNANLNQANLSNAVFELIPGALPNIVDAARAKNLSELKIVNSPHTLFELREEFRKNGNRQQERELTFAIKHNETLAAREDERLVRKIEGVLNYVAFESTTKWGMSPERALLVVGWLFLFFTPAYVLVLRSVARDGIWRVWDDERVRQDLGSVRRERVMVGWGCALMLGCYFSVLSAFRVGWRDLNVGSWISRIQPREYTYRASGWVRTVSGIQSLMSVYLLALWALTYFGRPFD